MNRVNIAALVLSAASLTGIAMHEGYRDRAYIPIEGDRPTLGFGDAQGVKVGDKTDPIRALIRLNQQVETFQQEMKKCLGDVPLYQYEWDAYVSLTFNIGSGAFCKSTLVNLLKKNNYKEACEQILKWDKFKGSAVKGLTIRRQSEYKKCIGQ